jgi:hypothetical protein
MNVVTSFSPSGWDIYGKRFVDSFLANWPSEAQLHCFLEGQNIPPGYPQVAWHDLENDPEHEAFCSKYSGPEFNDPKDYAGMAVRFCHKVFAVTSTGLPPKGWRIWIDADVVFTRDVTAFLPQLLPEGKALTYLGRKGHMRPGQPAHSECGFVAYNCDIAKVRAMLLDMRAIYTTGRLFSLGKYNQHDSYVFDYCREHHHFGDGFLNNLSAHARPNETHVWPSSLLGKFSEHYKGPRRKAAAYGRT